MASATPTPDVAAASATTAELPPSSPSLWRTLRNLQGNARAATWTEPMWGLSMALVLPYASVFMRALGLADQQIGLIATIGMVVQVGFGLASGIVTDKLGRRRTTAMFDVLAWVVPCLIWAVAQNFWFFLAASVVNANLQIVQNSWDCLLVEDADRAQIPALYSLIRVAAELSAIFAPIAAILVMRLGLETAVRILYVNAAIVMLAKIIILYRFSTETRTGRERMAATQGVSYWRLLAGYRGILAMIVRSPGSLFSLAVMALVAAVSLVNTTFWPILVTEHLHVPEHQLPFFAMVRSGLAILFFFTLIPRLTSRRSLRLPTAIGFLVYLVAQLLLVAIPAATSGASPIVYVLLGICLVLESFAGGILFMLAESLVALHVDEQERSRVMGIQRTVVMLAAAPFGWIAGTLSGAARDYPFLLTAALLGIGLLLTFVAWVPPTTEEPMAVIPNQT